MGSALNFAEMKLIFLVLVTLVVTVPEATGTPHLLYDLCNRLVAHCHTNSCSGSGSGSAQPQPSQWQCAPNYMAIKKGKQLPGRFAKDMFSIKKASTYLDRINPFFKAKFKCTQFDTLI